MTSSNLKKLLRKLLRLQKIVNRTATSVDESNKDCKEEDRDITPFIDLKVQCYPITQAYTEKLGKSFKLSLDRLTPEENKELQEYYVTLRIQSPLIMHFLPKHVSIEDDLKTIYSDAIAKLKEDFTKVLASESKFDNPYAADTLLFCCIYSYNLRWDPYHLSFDSPHYDLRVKKYIKSNNLKNTEPYVEQCFKRAVELAGVLYKYYEAKSKPRRETESTLNVVFEFNKQPIQMQDPLLCDWVLRSIIENLISDKYPAAAAGYVMDDLCKIIKRLEQIHSSLALEKVNQFWDSSSQTESSKKDFQQGFEEENKRALKELKELCILKAPSYSGVKSRVTKEFCESIHPIFCYFMETSSPKYTNTQLRIYNSILKLFQMDDFDTSKYKPDQKSTTKYAIEKRLRELLNGTSHSK